MADLVNMRRGVVDPETGKFSGVVVEGIKPGDIERYKAAGYEMVPDEKQEKDPDKAPAATVEKSKTKGK